MTSTLLRFSIPLLLLAGFFKLSSGVNRSDTLLLLSLYSGIFILLWYWIRNFSTVWSILTLGILARLVFHFDLPFLSQDIYRYLWDGQIQQLGINPYLYTPDQLIEIVGFPDARLLVEKMEALSAAHFSNYPPASQLLFKAAALFHQEDFMPAVVFLRSLYLVFDIVLFFVGVAFLKRLHLEPILIAWYFLNPLVIVEGIGNLHGESLMFCFSLLGLGYALQKKALKGGVFLGIAIAIKLLPLLFIPFFYKYLGVKKFSLFCFSIALCSVFFWLPFWEGNMAIHYKETLDLWFTNFEFNGSLYNLIRAIGYKIKGYNIIRQLGQLTPFLILGLTLALSLLRSNRTADSILKSLLILLSGYFFISTTVHPWYIINLIFLGIATGYAYPLVWSLTVFWSYSAYGPNGFEENVYLQFTQYLLVYGFVVWEFVNEPLGEHFQKSNFFRIETSPISSR
jgi:alpha-1,6-mannosyltransferase